MGTRRIFLCGERKFIGVTVIFSGGDGAKKVDLFLVVALKPQAKTTI